MSRMQTNQSTSDNTPSPSMASDPRIAAGAGSFWLIPPDYICTINARQQPHCFRARPTTSCLPSVHFHLHYCLTIAEAETNRGNGNGGQLTGRTKEQLRYHKGGPPDGEEGRRVAVRHRPVIHTPKRERNERTGGAAGMCGWKMECK